MFGGNISGENMFRGYVRIPCFEWRKATLPDPFFSCVNAKISFTVLFGAF